MKKTVLIVDDSRGNLYLLKSIMEVRGWVVFEAENGKDALEIARVQRPGLIISDILMPVMDGYGFCRECKKDKILRDIPFVFYTATYTESKDEKFALDLGADRFILKPEEPEVLIKVLMDLLDEKDRTTLATAKPLGEEMEFFRRHNEILFNKLEKKMSDLEIANQELRKLEEDYRLSFENATDIIFSLDGDLNVLSMSPSVGKILGYQPTDFIGRKVHEFHHILSPQALEQALNNINRILKGAVITSSVYQMIAQDRSFRHIEVSGSPLTRKGNIIGMVCIARDITERKNMEDALQESEEKYRGILENMDDAYYEVDLKGNLTFFNQALVNRTGYKREELMGMNYRHYISPNCWRQVQEIFAQVYQTGRAVTLFDYEIHLKDGRKRFQESWVNLILDKNNNPLGFRGMARDVTDRKIAEKELRQAEERYRSIFENAQEGMYRAGANEKFIMVNQAMARIFGYDSAAEFVEQVNTSAHQLYRDREDRKKIFHWLETQGLVQDFEARFFRRDGSVGWISVNIQQTQEGNTPFYDGFVRDVTDRKESVEHLREAFAGTVSAIALLVEAKDPYTAGHQRRVADIACAIALEMGLSQERIEGILMAGTMHDIGKVSIPAEILSSPRRLTALEFSLIKTHAQSGYDILKDIKFSWPIARMVQEHHERMDGSGYPQGLKGIDILLESRILAVADVVEAMATHRPYRAALGVDLALREITENRGVLFDTEAVDACLRLFREKPESRIKRTL
jgi:PAS domain S-box-containing protein